ncbi:MAG: hypothetical protein AB8B39_04295, partial [Prochlorococcus sp.]
LLLKADSSVFEFVIFASIPDNVSSLAVLLVSPGADPMAPIASTGAATEVISNTAFIEDDRVLRAAEKRGSSQIPGEFS